MKWFRCPEPEALDISATARLGSKNLIIILYLTNEMQCSYIPLRWSPSKLLWRCGTERFQLNRTMCLPVTWLSLQTKIASTSHKEFKQYFSLKNNNFIMRYYNLKAPVHIHLIHIHWEPINKDCNRVTSGFLLLQIRNGWFRVQVLGSAKQPKTWHFQ